MDITMEDLNRWDCSECLIKLLNERGKSNMNERKRFYDRVVQAYRTGNVGRLYEEVGALLAEEERVQPECFGKFLHDEEKCECHCVDEGTYKRCAELTMDGAVKTKTGICMPFMNNENWSKGQSKREKNR